MKNIYITLISLGIIQGVAEFLPISSSGHLVLFEQMPFFKASLHSIGTNLELFINVSLHVATLIAVIIYYRKDIGELIAGTLRSYSKGSFTSDKPMTVYYILLASIPAGVIGIALNDQIEILFSSFLAVSIMLIVNGFVLFSTKFIKPGNRQLESTGILNSLIIGLFQAFAIIPGISRSGSTISGGMLRGLDPVASARFSFLMSIPVIAGAGLLEGLKALERGLDSSFYIPLGISMMICVIVAYLCLGLLIYIVKKLKMYVFGYYTIAIGLIGILIYMFS
jgi:undecaprenyl-diphosphatase